MPYLGFFLSVIRCKINCVTRNEKIKNWNIEEFWHQLIVFCSFHLIYNHHVNSLWHLHFLTCTRKPTYRFCLWKQFDVEVFFYSKTLKGLILIQCRINELSFLYLSETCVSGQVLEIILESIQKIKGTRLLH